MPRKSKNQQAISRPPLTSPTASHQIGGAMDRISNWLPPDNKSFFYELVVLVCLTIAIVDYVVRGDTGLLVAILSAVEIFVGGKPAE